MDEGAIDGAAVLWLLVTLASRSRFARRPAVMRRSASSARHATIASSSHVGARLPPRSESAGDNAVAVVWRTTRRWRLRRAVRAVQQSPQG
jgi:hypothetical protein